MRIIADTNVLLRAIVGDDPAQAHIAIAELENADVVAVSLHAVCELAWVLQRSYGVSSPDIAAAIRQLAGTRNVEINRAAVESGLRMLVTGGDFADGVIDFDGRWLGGEIFVSFDRKAVTLLTAQGRAARQL